MAERPCQDVPRRPKLYCHICKELLELDLAATHSNHPIVLQERAPVRAHLPEGDQGEAVPTAKYVEKTVEQVVEEIEESVEKIGKFGFAMGDFDRLLAEFELGLTEDRARSVRRLAMAALVGELVDSATDLAVLGELRALVEAFLASKGASVSQADVDLLLDELLDESIGYGVEAAWRGHVKLTLEAVFEQGRAKA